MSEGPEGTLNGRVGDGEADVVITSSGGVTLLSRSDGGSFVYGFEPEDEEMSLDLELESMSEEIERNIEAHMARLNAHLEAELSRIDHSAIQLKAEKAAELSMTRYCGVTWTIEGKAKMNWEVVVHPKTKDSPPDIE